jgi:hypothetical protein
MKSRWLLFVLSSVLMAAFVAGIYPVRSAHAQCGPNLDQPCGPDNGNKQKKLTQVASPSPANPNPNPNGVPTVQCPPNVPPNPGNPTSGGSATNPGPSPINGSFFDLRALGGGIFVGLLLGGFGGFRLGLLRIRESPLTGGSMKNGSFFDDPVGKGTPGGGDIHGSFFDKSAGKGTPGGGDDGSTQGFDTDMRKGGDGSTKGFDVFTKGGGGGGPG